MKDLQQIIAFAKVVETGSFTQAANKLGIAKSSISKQIAALETSLGVRLITRTTRQVHVTDEGMALYEQCLRIEDEIETMRRKASGFKVAPQGVLRICAPPLLGTTMLASLIPRFLEQYEDLSIDCRISDKLEDLVSVGFDLGIRIGEFPDAALSGQLLAKVHSTLCASPQYLQEKGYPQTPQDIQHHKCLLWQPQERLIMKEWVLDNEGKTHRVSVTGKYINNDAIAIKQAAVNHAGLAMLPAYAIGEEIEQGKLEIVLPEYLGLPLPIYAVYPHRQNLSAKVHVFIDYLKQEFSQFVTDADMLEDNGGEDSDEASKAS